MTCFLDKSIRYSIQSLNAFVLALNRCQKEKGIGGILRPYLSIYDFINLFQITPSLCSHHLPKRVRPALRESPR